MPEKIYESSFFMVDFGDCLSAVRQASPSIRGTNGRFM